MVAHVSGPGESGLRYGARGCSAGPAASYLLITKTIVVKDVRVLLVPDGRLQKDRDVLHYDQVAAAASTARRHQVRTSSVSASGSSSSRPNQPTCTRGSAGAPVAK